MVLTSLLHLHSTKNLACLHTPPPHNNTSRYWVVFVWRPASYRARTSGVLGCTGGRAPLPKSTLVQFSHVLICLSAVGRLGEGVEGSSAAVLWAILPTPCWWVWLCGSRRYAVLIVRPESRGYLLIIAALLNLIPWTRCISRLYRCWGKFWGWKGVIQTPGQFNKLGMIFTRSAFDLILAHTLSKSSLSRITG